MIRMLGMIGLAGAVAMPIPPEAGRGDAYKPGGRVYEGLQSRHVMDWKPINATTLGNVTMMQNAPAQPPPSAPRAEWALVPKLTVSGQATLDKPADRMHLQIGVVTDADDAQTAMSDNSKKMSDVIAALQKAGLGKDEYSTGQFQIHPRYSHPPRNPQPDWKPSITGYQVINRIHVKTTKLNLAGELIEAATEAGANNVDSISFDLADPRKHRAEAIAEATANARADAEALARAAGQKLVRILQVSLDHAPVQPLMEMRDMRAMAMAESEGAPPIEPGDVTVHANVTIVYEIAQQ